MTETLQNCIASRMSVTIVDALEVVEIKQDQCDRLRIMTIGLYRVFNILIKTFSVPQFRQRVCSKQTADGVRQPAVLNNLVDQEEQNWRGDDN